MNRQQLFRKKKIDSNLGTEGQLNRTLNVRDLTFLGIAAVIGAGIFSTIGKAAYEGGPGVIFLFLIAALTCGLAAMCYAEFASRVPASGSAYTYAYVAFGELIAWIIGWALILEYAIGNVVVAISWSSYFDNVLKSVGVNMPEWLLTDGRTAAAAYADNVGNIAQRAYERAPQIGTWKVILNLPAFFITLLITLLAMLGIRESKRSANAMVIFKLAVLLVVILVGAFYIQTDNYSPFFPNGFSGVMGGVSAVFYAYIGFDAISTTAEECKDPQRSLPRGMIYSLLICTGIYIILALVLTGMVSYKEFFQVTDPLAFVFEGKSPWVAKLINFSAIIATTGVLLVFQIGQPRIWMSMSRDGLLPARFSKIHPKYRTPLFATIVAGVLVAIPSLLIDANLVTDLTSIGTLFAFAIVCAGVLVLPRPTERRGFRIPYVPGGIWVSIAYIVFVGVFWSRSVDIFRNLNEAPLKEILFILFQVLAFVIVLLTWRYKFSLIPILGLLFCLYLMVEIPSESWVVFFIWMLVGLSIYAMYGYRKSKNKLPDRP